MPFIAEHIYKAVSDSFESVHLENWPEVDKKLIDGKLPLPESRLDQDKRWMCRSCQYAEDCFRDTPDIDLGNFL